MLKTTIAVAFAMCVAHSEELERKNVKDLYALREERRLGSWDTTGGSGSGSGSGSASKSWSSSWDTEPDAPSTTVYQCGCDAYLENDNGNNDNGGGDNGGENGGENGGGDNGGENGGENNSGTNSGTGSTGSGSGSGSGSSSWSTSGSKSWSTSGSKSGSWSSDSMESSTQPPRPKYDSFCDCMCDCEGSGEYVIVEDNNDGGNNNNNNDNNNNNNNDNSGSSWSTSSSKSSKSSTSSWSSGSSWSSSNPCGSNSVSGSGGVSNRRRMGKSWSTDTTSGGSKGWSTDSGSGSYDEPCPSTTVANNDDDMTSTMYASTSGTQEPPPRPETTMITCQCNGTTEEPLWESSTTEACPENSNYFILSRGWDISSLEDDISLYGRYDQDGSKFVNSDTNYTIWFEQRSGEYQLAVGDPWEDDLILFYIEPVSSWTDDSNPLTNSDDESLWEANGESVEFQTGNMTLYDCNGENLGTDVYTSYSHIYVSGSINIIPTYGIYALMAVMYMVAVMF